MLGDRPAGQSGPLFTGALHRRVRPQSWLRVDCRRCQVSSTFDPSLHPVLGCVATMGSALKATADVQVMFMAPADKGTALVELARVEAQVAGLRLRVMAAAEDVA